MSSNASRILAAKAPAVRRAAMWWAADVIGAALFAGSLALWLGAAVEPGQASDRSRSALVLLLTLALSGCFRAFVQAQAIRQGQIAAAVVKQGLRERLFRALLPTGLSRGRLPGEDLVTAIDNVEVAEGYVGRFVPIRAAAVMGPFICAALAALASWVAAAIMLATLIPFALGMALAGNSASIEADRQFQALARMSGLFVDRARMLPTIVAFAAEERVTGQISVAAYDVAQRTLRVLRIAFVSSAILEFFAALSVALVAVYCGFSLLGLLPFAAPEKLDLMRAFFVLALAPEFYLGMRRMAASYHEKQQGEAAARGIAPELAHAEDLLAAMGTVTETSGPLAVEGLIIRYGDGNRIGPVTASWPTVGLHVITGPTGAGKSSLLYALVGMAPTAAGQILSSGGAVAPGSFNTSIAWSGQRPFLLPGSLEDNLLLGAKGDARPEWREVIARLGLGGLIRVRGADLVIDPAGSGMSGGERRRIGLARAILSGRPVMLLDEPTADLDTTSANRVVDTLLLEARHRLVLVATHDPRLISAAQSEVSIS